MSEERLERIEQRFDKMEEMISTLITTVGHIMEEQTNMRNEQKLMKEQQDTRHQEVMEKLTTIEADHNHTWEKVVKNERDVSLMKSLLKL